ncbi:MAG: MerR family transcriptional regulator [Bacteroidia bacterium]|nr:MerR family transcriptional regulator [Bacteroidia bacterium]
MGTFSIKDIEAVTGIKGHTLRIWEQRYGIVKPKRTETNIRFYDDCDMKSLLNIKVLNENGFKISEIARMSKTEITDKVIELSNNSQDFNIHICAFVSAMMSFDEACFHKLLGTYICQFGIEETFIKIISPFLNQVGMLWQVGTIQPVHEHFVSNIIKQKLYVAIDAQVGKYAEHRKRFLLFLPEYEKHSMALLFANYIIRSRGHEVLYLGQEVPLADLKNAFEKENPHYILTMMTASQAELDKQAFVDFMVKNWKDSKILLTGAQFNCAKLQLCAKTKKLNTLEEFMAFINALSPSWACDASVT